jgi:uncharacterized protein
MVAMSRIHELADLIAEQFQPNRIILFGSHSAGTAHQDSDVDLLVVMPHQTKNWQMAASIRNNIRVDFPLDLIVRRPEEMSQRIAAGDVFLKNIQELGEILYERGHA